MATPQPKSEIEHERKHRVQGVCWADKAAIIDKIADFVADETTHFATLEAAPHSDGFDKELVAAARMPFNARPLHRRIYWAARDLAGYGNEDAATVEIRLEHQPAKGNWQQTVKLGAHRPTEKTLSRREIESDVAGFAVDLDLLPEDARRDANVILGGQLLKPVICLQGQGVPILYHPDGHKDLLFEIKFDKGKGFSFDGESCDIVEIEIELKQQHASADLKEIERLFEKSDDMLYRAFPDQIKRSNESKPTELFRHLRKWRARDRAVPSAKTLSAN